MLGTGLSIHNFGTQRNKQAYLSCEPRKTVSHPETGKLIQRNYNTRSDLHKITKSCDSFKKMAQKSKTLRAALPPAKILFNCILLMDLAGLESKTWLNIVDEYLHFSAACLNFTHWLVYCVYLASHYKGRANVYVG